MAETTSIAWTHRTYNPWWGCTKVGPGCDICYAAALDHRLGGNHWGVNQPRRFFKDAHWNEPLKWDRDAMAGDPRKLIFCASMADVFDNEVEQHHRDRLWRLIKATGALTWQIVTKRIGNAPRMLPDDWWGGYPNVWLLSTVVNQEEADRDIDKLLAVPARIHGLSIEPQLAHVNVARWLSAPGGDGVSWVISGGESGGRARPYSLGWARSLRDQCAGAGAAFFLKQLGSRPIGIQCTGKAEDPEEWPPDLRVREFPE